MRTEIKLLLTALLIYCVFLRWSGMTGNSILAEIRAISENNTFAIDDFANTTSDRALIGSNYYSDKEPGLAFISLPTYSAYRILTFDASIGKGDPAGPILEVNGIKIMKSISDTPQLLGLLIILTIVSSTLPNSLTSVLVYKMGKSFFGETTSIIVALVYIFGSLAFHYSIGLMSYGVSAFFVFLSFYILFRKKDDNRVWHELMAGIASGIAFTINPLAAPAAAFIALYILVKNRKAFMVFGIGALIGVAPMLVYNLVLMGNPIDLPRLHEDPLLWANLQNTTGFSFSLDNIFIVYRLLVDPYKGLLYYYPIVAVSIAGLLHMSKSDRRAEALLITSIFAGVLLLAASFWGWWHGGVFGPRFLMFSAPFMALPLGFAIESSKKNKFVLFVIASLVTLSVVTNMLGLTLFYEDNLKDLSNSSQMAAQFSSYVYSLKPLPDVLVNYYFPDFARYGPRSRAVENLLAGKFPDINDFTYVESKLPFINLSFFILSALFWLMELCPKKCRQWIRRP